MPDTAFREVATARLRLRRFRDGDLDAFQAYRSDPDVARYQSWDTPYSRADAEAFLAEMMATHPDTPGQWFQFAVADLEHDRLLGDVALFCDETGPEAEIGYSLAPEATGRGYASEAVAAVLDYALPGRRKSLVRAWADTRNARSLALLARLGFEKPDEPFRRSWFKGEWSDETLHGMTAARWDALRAAGAD